MPRLLLATNKNCTLLLYSEFLVFGLVFLALLLCLLLSLFLLHLFRLGLFNQLLPAFHQILGMRSDIVTLFLGKGLDGLAHVVLLDVINSEGQHLK